MGDIVKMEPGECRVQYDRHPTQTHLVAICMLPKGHRGEHSNVLPKPEQRILRTQRGGSGR